MSRAHAELGRITEAHAEKRLKRTRDERVGRWFARESMRHVVYQCR